MTCLLYGNCHMKSLAKILETCPEFSKKYKCKPILVHEISKAEADKIFQEKYDLIIYQNITKNYRGLNYGSNEIASLGAGKKIKLTNAYYSGYFPDSGYFYDKDGEHIGEVQDYILFYRWMWKVAGVKNKRIEYCSYDYPKEKENFPIYQPDFYTPGYNFQEHHLSLARLDWRDDLFNADVRVANFIRENYQKKRLFHTMNHPTLALFEEEARQILKILGIKDKVEENKSKDLMDFLELPIYVSTYINLKLQFFEKEKVYRRNSVNRTPEQEYDAISKFYLTVDGDLRDFNLNSLLAKKISFWN